MSTEKKTFDDFLAKKMKDEEDKGNHKTVSMLKKAREYFKKNPSEAIKKLEGKE